MTNYIIVIGAVRHTHSIVCVRAREITKFIACYVLLSGVLWSNLFQVRVRVRVRVSVGFRTPMFAIVSLICLLSLLLIYRACARQ